MKLLEHFHKLSIYPKNAKELKGLVLQLAVQGKLTRDWRLANPDVEPAAVLLERIKAEKQELIKAKKIKKEKALPAIEAEEIPFELPNSWAWCRLGDVIHLEMGQSPKGDSYNKVGEGIPLINGPVEFGPKPFDKTLKTKFTTKPTKMCKEGDLLLCVRGSTTGRTNIAGFDACIGRGVAALRAFFVKDFLNYYILKSRAAILGKGTGTAFPSISRNDILCFLFPLPSFQEQKAIVKIVDTLLQEVTQLEQLTQQRLQLKEKYVTVALNQVCEENTAKAWADLKGQFSTFFNEEGNIKKLRETILQLAVQGKLTANWRLANPDVEPAAVLLERIKTKKQELIKAKKIRKEKVFATNLDIEIPYKIPLNWVWCRFQEIVINRDGERVPLSKEIRKTRQGKYDYYGASKVIDKIDEYIFDKDLLLIGEDGANLINRSTPIAFFARGKYWVNNHAHVIDAVEFGILEFLEKYINSISLEDYITGMAQPKMPQKRMNIIKVPLPPLKEQKAIVEKVNQLMDFCDNLEEEIIKSKKTAEELMQVVLKEVFEGKVVETV